MNTTYDAVARCLYKNAQEPRTSLSDGSHCLGDHPTSQIRELVIRVVVRFDRRTEKVGGWIQDNCG